MCFFYLIEHFNKGSVKLGLRHFLQEAVHPKVNDTVPQRTGLSAQGTCQVAFTAPRGAGDKDVLCPVNEQSVSKLHKLIRCYVARRITIHLFKDCIIPEFALPEIK